MATVTPSRQDAPSHPKSPLFQDPSTSNRPSTVSKASKSNDSYSNAKVVLRLLPPTLDENGFYDQLSVFYDLNSPNIANKYYVQGSYPTKPYEAPIYSRAYISFYTSDDSALFQSTVHGKPFVEPETEDSFTPLVERAISNKMPAKDSKYEPTTEKSSVKSSEMFQEFMKFLNGEVKEYNIVQLAKTNKRKAREKLKNERKKEKKAAKAAEAKIAKLKDKKEKNKKEAVEESKSRKLKEPKKDSLPKDDESTEETKKKKRNRKSKSKSHIDIEQKTPAKAANEQNDSSELRVQRSLKGNETETKSNNKRSRSKEKSKEGEITVDIPKDKKSSKNDKNTREVQARKEKGKSKFEKNAKSGPAEKSTTSKNSEQSDVSDKPKKVRRKKTKDFTDKMKDDGKKDHVKKDDTKDNKQNITLPKNSKQHVQSEQGSSVSTVDQAPKKSKLKLLRREEDNSLASK